MRILLLSSWFPYPPDNGSRIRLLNMIKGLSKRHEVTLLCLSRSADADRENAPMLEGYCKEVKIVPGRPFQPRRMRALFGFLSPCPRSLVDTYSPEMAALVQTMVARNEYDLLLASQLGMAQYATAGKGIPKVWEEVEIAILQEQRLKARSWLGRFRYGLTWWKLAHYIRSLSREFVAFTVASEQEKEILEDKLPDGVVIGVISNGLDLSRYGQDYGPPIQDALVYPGAVTYFANYDAVEYFARDILPLIREKRPGAILRVTGGTEGVSLEHLDSLPGMEFTGYVADIQPVIARSWACVVPLRTGGGTRLKILEAMALGTPVVSTPKGAEGLEVTPGEDILIAETPAVFAGQVVELLGDGQLRDRLATNGRRLVAEKYDWEKISRDLEGLLEDALMGRRQ